MDVMVPTIYHESFLTNAWRKELKENTNWIKKYIYNKQNDDKILVLAAGFDLQTLARLNVENDALDQAWPRRGLRATNGPHCLFEMHA